MSTAHIYGDPPTAVCTETSAEGIGFAPAVGRAWEAAFAESKLPDQRGVIMRTDPELALYGRYVVSQRLAEEGFHFAYPELEQALRELDGRSD
jgi:NAD dependent epimerase/dehydratase family enzyme